jgi:hypothetical protein
MYIRFMPSRRQFKNHGVNINLVVAMLNDGLCVSLYKEEKDGDQSHTI